MEGNELDRLDQELDCPLCLQPTRSLKQYRVMRWCVFYLAGAVWQVKIVRACPACMRATVWKSALINLVPANLLWLLLLLPWSMVLTLMTLVHGHSKAVLEGLTPTMVVAREMQGREISMNRVMAILALVLCWVPLLGLIVGVIAWRVNRLDPSWTRTTSLIGLILTGLCHLALLGLFIKEAIEFGF